MVIPAEAARELELNEGETIDADIRKCQRVDAFGVFKGAKPFRREEKEHKGLW